MLPQAVNNSQRLTGEHLPSLSFSDLKLIGFLTAKGFLFYRWGGKENGKKRKFENATTLHGVDSLTPHRA